MINNLNLIILKLFIYKKFFYIYNFSLKKNNLIFNSFFYKSNDRGVFKNELIFYFYKFYFFEKEYKSLNFNKLYLNFFLKNISIFSSCLYNYYVNNFFFFKKFNKNYLSFPFKKTFFQNKVFFVLKKKKFYKNNNFYDFFFNLNLPSRNLKVFNNKFIFKDNFNITVVYENFYFHKTFSKTLFFCSFLHFKSKFFNVFNYNLELVYTSFFKKLRLIFFFKSHLIKENYFFEKRTFNFKKSDLNKYILPKNKPCLYIDMYIFRFFFLKSLFIFFQKNAFSGQFISINKIKNNKNFPIFVKNIKNIFKNINYLDDIFYKNTFMSCNNFTFINSFFFLKILKTSGNSLSKLKFFRNDFNNIYYNNYYPIFYSSSFSRKRFFSKFKTNFNVNYFVYFNHYILSFLENFLKKNIFLKISNNFFNKIKINNNLNSVYLENKNFQPKYFKNFLIIDFLDLLWYSLYLKDLTLISSWVSKLLECIHFKFHRKFILFFQNFVNKYERVFYDIFHVNGFFFDIRGKVGVTGNSKKRHFFFKIGEIKRSTKKKKIEFKQSLVRTPSGVLGLTFILSY